MRGRAQQALLSYMCGENIASSCCNEYRLLALSPTRELALSRRGSMRAVKPWARSRFQRQDNSPGREVPPCVCVCVCPHRAET